MDWTNIEHITLSRHPKILVVVVIPELYQSLLTSEVIGIRDVMGFREDY